MAAKATVKVTWTDNGLNTLIKQIRDASEMRTTVGYQGAGGLNQVESGGPTTAAVAQYNEFGTRTIPARPFLRNALKGSGSALQAATEQGVAAIVAGSGTAEDLLEELGDALKDEVQRKLDTSRSWATPNAPSTIRQKGAQYPPLKAGHDRLTKDLSWAVRSGSSIVREGK